MIKRILDPDQFKRLIDDMSELFAAEDSVNGHALVTHNKESIKANFAHPALLAWDFFVWGHEERGKFDAMIAFFKNKDPKFGEEIFCEFLWLSKNPKVGYQLFRTAKDFAREDGFKFIIMNTVVKNPSHEKLKHFYQNLGFIKDSESYIARL
jgi:GNAT superfamily N-acetyltransferase